jgi:hypothetical protein
LEVLHFQNPSNVPMINSDFNNNSHLKNISNNTSQVTKNKSNIFNSENGGGKGVVGGEGGLASSGVGAN